MLKSLIYSTHGCAFGLCRRTLPSIQFCRHKHKIKEKFKKRQIEKSRKQKAAQEFVNVPEKLEEIIAQWKHFLPLESAAKLGATLEREKHIFEEGEEFVRLPLLKWTPAPEERGALLEFSLEEINASQKKNIFSDVYKHRAKIQVRADNGSESELTYNATIYPNQNPNVLKVLLHKCGHRNLAEVERWAIRITNSEQFERLLTLLHSGKYKQCIGYPHLLKCFGLRPLDEVNTDGWKKKNLKLPEELNASQKIAILSALNEHRDFVAIQGPPGTGKTRVIAEIVYQQSLQKKNHIIVCAPSNKAVDNALIACLERGVQADICTRLGVGSDQQENEQLSSAHFAAMFKQHTFYQEFHDLYKKQDNVENKKDLDTIIKRGKDLEKFIVEKIMQNVRIIFCTATCGALFSKFIDTQLFKPDLVIMDEAAQILEPTSWQILLEAPRFVLVGDHKQLDAHIQLDGREAAKKKSMTEQLLNVPKFDPMVLVKKMSVSLLERLATDVLKDKEGYMHMLNTNYRSNALINRWSNQHFYENRLNTDDTVENITLADIVQKPDTSRFTGAHENLVKIEENGPPFFIQEPLVLVDTAKFSEADLQECRQRYPQLVMADFEEAKRSNSTSSFNIGEALCAAHHLLALKHIGGLQSEDFGCITPYLAQTKLIKKFLCAEQFDISSVDAFQGQQREAIVMSFVRSNKQNNIGFMDNLNRMNVAITRAKRQFLLIASSKMLRGNKKFKELRDLYELIHREGRIVNPKELLLNSPFQLGGPDKEASVNSNEVEEEQSREENEEKLCQPEELNLGREEQKSKEEEEQPGFYENFKKLLSRK